MRKLLCIFVYLAFAGAVSPAQGAESARPAVEAAFGAWVKSLSGGSSAAIVGHYNPDAVLLATLKQEPVTDQAGRTAYFDKLVKLKGLRVAVESEKVTMLAGDTAGIVSGLYRFEYEAGGKTVAIPARYSFVYVSTPQGWKIQNHHSSELPEAAQ